MKKIFLVLVPLMLNASPWIFRVSGESSLSKYGGTLKRRSAYASVAMKADLIRLKDSLFLMVGGKEAVWMGRDKGPIQLDPQQADYLLQGGVIKYLTFGKYIGVILDHPCYHQIDTLVVRSLYWNKIKLIYGNYRTKKPLQYRKLRYHIEVGSFLRHKDIPWLTKGLDFQFDIYARAEYAFLRVGEVKIYTESQLYMGISMNYNFHPSLEINLGFSIAGEEGEGRFFVGIRPIDRKTFREAEGAPYIGIKILY
ncbi:MAG: hypothetical protein DRQ03_05135 [Candidatus Hydrothermota bacterium]|nr:MAG: hypothetical protein DRQ03_05135 [Candidatus Hydrothermae bacterium]